LGAPNKDPLRVIGLSGGIGSGKSAAADCFVARGVRVIDTDQISHSLTGKSGAAIPDIVRAFGPQAIDRQGAMDRAAMRELVFADPVARKKLEAILHPEIAAAVDRELAQLRGDQGYQHAYVLLAIPLLFERMSFRWKLWRTLVIDCAESTQIARVARRSGLPVETIVQVVQAQISRNVRLQLADDVIWNGGDLLALDRTVDTFHCRYTRKIENDRS
jgi:dephospho-CoA kinase